MDDPTAKLIENACHGIIIVDKPEGYSSAKAVARLKKIPWIKKTGHTGTLDPFASGVMICGINSGTRLSKFFLHGNKTYIAELVLGTETDTQDSTGKTTSSFSGDLHALSHNQIKMVIETFKGQQKQLPPIYSALKHNGTPLYKLARKGKPVQKPAREINIHHINILKMDLPSVWFEVSCSAGTYIRTLCNDIGKKLGCGGHLKSLRRTKSSDFTIDKALSLEKIIELESKGALKKKIISMSNALQGMPYHIANDEMVEKVQNGKTLKRTELPFTFENKKEKFVKIINEKGKLLAIISDTEDRETYKYCCVFNN